MTRQWDLDGLRLHDLRHTAVTLWIAAGANPKEIAVRAGHSSVVTVLDRYGHLYPEAEDRLSDALDAMAGRGHADACDCSSIHAATSHAAVAHVAADLEARRTTPRVPPLVESSTHLKPRGDLLGSEQLLP